MDVRQPPPSAAPLDCEVKIGLPVPPGSLAGEGLTGGDGPWASGLSRGSGCEELMASCLNRKWRRQPQAGLGPEAPGC